MSHEMLSDKALAEIEAEIARRNDATAMESACGEYNCPCHYRIPALCATVRALRAEIADYEQTNLIPRSRYEAADADREEARQQFRDIAKKATVEIERLESENTALRDQLAQLQLDHNSLTESYKELEEQYSVKVIAERDRLSDDVERLARKERERQLQ